MTAAGALILQYLPQPTGCPDFAETEVPTTFALAPMGVPLPPISVPIESAHAMVSSETPVVAESDLMIGIIVAAKGMLSMKALAIADTQMMMAIIT